MSFPKLYANSGLFSIALPEPATLAPGVELNSAIVTIPVSRVRVGDDIRVI